MKVLLVVMGVLFASEAAEAGVFKTADHGRSWVRADVGLPAESRVNGFASLGGDVFAATDAGVFVSYDAGRNWTRSGWTGRVLAVIASGTRLFAGTDGSGVVVSADKGMTWVVTAGFPDKKVRSLVSVPSMRGGGVVYAGTEKAGVAVSSDGGASWSVMRDGLPEGAQIFAMSSARGKVFAGLYGKGLFVWEGRWRKVGPVAPLVLAAAGDTLLAGHNPGGVYRSEDGGGTWTKGAGELGAEVPVWEMGAGEGFSLTGAGNGIFYSEDGGKTWGRARTGLPAESPGISFLIERGFALAGTPPR